MAGVGQGCYLAVLWKTKGPIEKKQKKKGKIMQRVAPPPDTWSPLFSGGSGLAVPGGVSRSELVSPLATGFWLLASGFWLLASGSRPAEETRRAC